jgi:hypothetical protein
MQNEKIKLSGKHLTAESREILGDYATKKGGQ